MPGYQSPFTGAQVDSAVSAYISGTIDSAIAAASGGAVTAANSYTNIASGAAVSEANTYTDNAISSAISSGGDIVDPVSRFLCTIPEGLAVEEPWYLSVELSASSGFSPKVSMNLRTSSAAGCLVAFNGATFGVLASGGAAYQYAGMPAIVDVKTAFGSSAFNNAVVSGGGYVRYQWLDVANTPMTDYQATVLNAAPAAENPVGMAANVISGIASEVTQLTPVVDDFSTTVNIDELSGGVSYSYELPVSAVTVSSVTSNSVGDIIHFTAAQAAVTVDLPPGLTTLLFDDISSGNQYDLMVCDNRVILKETMGVTS